MLSAFFGVMVGLAAPVFAVGLRGNKPFDDYRIPAAILIVAAGLVVGAIRMGMRRIWLLAGFSAGAALGVAAIGLLFLVYTYLHFV
jgi:hypothetical protein